MLRMIHVTRHAANKLFYNCLSFVYRKNRKKKARKAHICNNIKHIHRLYPLFILLFLTEMSIICLSKRIKSLANPLFFKGCEAFAIIRALSRVLPCPDRCLILQQNRDLYRTRAMVLSWSFPSSDAGPRSRCKRCCNRAFRTMGRGYVVPVSR